MKRFKWVLLWVVPAVLLVVVLGVFALGPVRTWLVPSPPATDVQKPPPATFIYKLADGQLLVTHSHELALGTCELTVEVDIRISPQKESVRDEDDWHVRSWPPGTTQRYKLPRLAKPDNCSVRPVRLHGIYFITEGDSTWVYTVDDKLDLPEWVPPDW